MQNVEVSSEGIKQFDGRLNIPENIKDDDNEENYITPQNEICKSIQKTRNISMASSTMS